MSLCLYCVHVYQAAAQTPLVSPGYDLDYLDDEFYRELSSRELSRAVSLCLYCVCVYQAAAQTPLVSPGYDLDYLDDEFYNTAEPTSARALPLTAVPFSGTLASIHEDQSLEDDGWVMCFLLFSLCLGRCCNVVKYTSICIAHIR